MPGRTLASMRDEVVANAFDATTYNPLVTLWLNEAQGRVARRMNLPERELSTTLNVIAGTKDYALPADLVVLTAVLDDRGELTPVGRDDIPVVAASGRPRVYALYGSTLTLYPTPNAAATFTLRYRGTVVDMVADTDTTVIPDDFNHILVSYALYKAYRKEDDTQMAQFYWQEFERDLRDMRASSQYRDSNRRRQIQGMWPARVLARFHRP